MEKIFSLQFMRQSFQVSCIVNSCSLNQRYNKSVHQAIYLGLPCRHGFTQKDFPFTLWYFNGNIQFSLHSHKIHIEMHAAVIASHSHNPQVISKQNAVMVSHSHPLLFMVPTILPSSPSLALIFLGYQYINF